MLQSTKKKIKSYKMTVLSQIITIAVALTVYLIMQFAVGSEKLGFEPIWMLFIVYFLGTFLFGFITGLITKSAAAFVFGSVSGVIGLEILLFSAADKKYWYVWVVIGVVLLVLLFVSTFFLKSDKLVVEFDNQPDSARKTYAEKKAEGAYSENKDEEEKPLPEVKSFKD